MSALAWRAASLAVVAALIALWGEIAALKLISPVFLPAPGRVWAALQHGLLRADLGEKLIGTVSHMLGGWAAASIAGVALGALIGSSRTARDYIAPTLEFLRPLPASAVIPVAIALFGLTPEMALGVIAFGSIWPVLLAAIHGFAAIEPRLVEVERVLGLTRWQRIAKISLPSATPDILAGLRLGLTVSLILAVVCEMIAGLDGLGQWVLLAARAYKSADIFAGVVLLGAIGVVANAAISVVESRMLRWRSTSLS
ncbi:ABC-type nitrate/sulfonate/bicarbonate transport system permease component [Roseiarcus fermentans]|uniref:ABC-type nitrate/sulfonate/bicarbonate transport system permease component n=1 Tax=Roseiarcus fermentans TaxID=1473586 RepID=A0A366EFM5_9HYPH|nr:ABC transporter permease [Roseiarcus fermentans]RBP01192.1 ABC-type nitrate/sulfonate/bicarbonate transport system permease component [Roseiarcus fermentans]